MIGPIRWEGCRATYSRYWRWWLSPEPLKDHGFVGRKKAAGFTFEQWRYAFTNTFTEEESRALYQRYHIPASVRVLWGSALATVEPGHQDTFVNYKNDDRAPLLFISGGEDHLMPPVSNAPTPGTTSPTP